MLSTIKEHVKHNFFQIQDYFSTHFCTDKYTPVTDSLENFITDIYAFPKSIYDSANVGDIEATPHSFKYIFKK
jgi:hypothetical protein